VKLKEKFTPKNAESRRKHEVRRDVAWKKGRTGKEIEEKEHWRDRNGWRGLVDRRGTYVGKSLRKKKKKAGGGNMVFSVVRYESWWT